MTLCGVANAPWNTRKHIRAHMRTRLTANAGDCQAEGDCTNGKDISRCHQLIKPVFDYPDKSHIHRNATLMD